MFGIGLGELIVCSSVLFLIGAPVVLVIFLVRRSQQKADSARKTARPPSDAPPP